MVRRRAIVVLLRDDGITMFLLTGSRCTDTRYIPGDLNSSLVSFSECARDLRTEWRADHIRVLLDMTATQVRRIDGLPHTRDAGVIERIVTTNPFRYFLRYTDRPIVSHAIVEQPGVATIALLDGELVETIARRIRTTGLIVDAIALLREHGPAAPQLPVGGDDLDVIWRGALRLPSTAWRAVESKGLPWWQMRPQTLAFVAICTLGTALHPAWQLFELRQREHQTQASQQTRLLVARRGVALDSLRIPLERLRAAAAASVHPLGVLDAISTVLPNKGRIVAFDVDTARVELTVSTPTLDVFLHRLERDPRVADLALTGAISHDTSGADEVEGAVVRFRFRDTGSARR